MNSNIFVGIIFGITFGVVIALILFTLSNKDNRVKTEYDERQQQIRGKGFKYGFFSMMGGIVLMIILKSSQAVIPVHDAVLLFFVMIIGVAVYVTYAIMNDAYFGLNNRINSYLLTFAFIALINLLVTIGCAMTGDLIVDGILGLNGINLLCAAMFIWIFIVLVIKKLSDEKED